MDFFTNRLLAAKQFWNQQKQQGEEFRRNLPQVTKEQASEQLKNTNFFKPQQSVEAPVVTAFKQRSLKPLFDPNRIVSNLGRFASNPMNAMGTGMLATTKRYIPKRLHPEDRQEIVNFIDNVRLRQPENIENEIRTRILANRYGLNPDIPNSRLANSFDKLLLTKFKQK